MMLDVSQTVMCGVVRPVMLSYCHMCSLISLNTQHGLTFSDI